MKNQVKIKILFYVLIVFTAINLLGINQIFKIVVNNEFYYDLYLGILIVSFSTIFYLTAKFLKNSNI